MIEPCGTPHVIFEKLEFTSLKTQIDFYCLNNYVSSIKPVL